MSPIEYAPGEAWCIARDAVVLVCERDLTAARAVELHERAADVTSADALRALLEEEPTALVGMVRVGRVTALLRRHGVPAIADGDELDARFGAEWSLDEVGADAVLEAGGTPALVSGALPFEGGVVRVAAIRVAAAAGDGVDAEDDEVDAALDEAPPAPQVGSFGETLPPRALEAERAQVDAPEPEPEPTPEPEPAPAPEPEPEPAPAPVDASTSIGGLIDSVPGFIRPAAQVPAHPEQEPEAHPAQQPEASAPAPSTSDLGDHDGLTITAQEARRLQAERQQRDGGVPVEASPATGPLVLSTLCAAGHVNAPGTDACATCGAAVDTGSAAQRRRPEIAVAVLPSGERIPLGRGVVLGRRPRSRRAEDGRVPRLVTVESPSEDISRSHVELRVEDWNLVAEDLSSTNGTLLLREGSAPQRLRPESATLLQLGDRLDLGDGVVVAIEAAT